MKGWKKTTVVFGTCCMLSLGVNGVGKPLVTHAATVSSSYSVKASTLNVRSGAGIRYKVIGTVKKGQNLSVIGKTSNGWYKVNFKGLIGYVNQGYIQVNLAKPASMASISVKASLPAAVAAPKPSSINSSSKTSLEPSPKPLEQSPVYGKTIVLDAGHGGFDVGATGVNGIDEKVINLSIVLKVASLLKLDGAKIILTRNDDTYHTLYDRTVLANNSKSDLFLSVHSNWNDHSSTTGVETFYYDHTVPGAFNPTDMPVNQTSKSKLLATSIENAMVVGTGEVNRGIADGDFHVIRETTIPSALVETGFLSNAAEDNKLCNDVYQNKIANAIYQALKKYFM